MGIGGNQDSKEVWLGTDPMLCVSLILPHLLAFVQDDKEAKELFVAGYDWSHGVFRSVWTFVHPIRTILQQSLLPLR